eukprot:8776720-Ditylum_brightwellii.AAC.1
MVTLSMVGKGLLSFAIPELAEDLIDKMNEKVESLQVATSTTAKELHNILTVQPMVKVNFSNFMLHLERYANLCYSLFVSASLAYLQTHRVIKALMALKAFAWMSISA